MISHFYTNVNSFLKEKLKKVENIFENVLTKRIGLFEETRFLKGCYFGSTRTFEDCIDDLNNILKEL